jgi:hypothetical protein
LAGSGVCIGELADGARLAVDIGDGVTDFYASGGAVE